MTASGRLRPANGELRGMGSRRGRESSLPHPKSSAGLADCLFALALFGCQPGFRRGLCVGSKLRFLVGFLFRRDLRVGKGLGLGVLLLLLFLVLAGDAPHAFLEAAEAFTQAFAEFRKLLAAEEKHCQAGHRSEERRVGKECRSRWSPYH